MDTPDMPHVVIPAKETFAPTTTASPKRRYNKKRYIAPRLKAIPKSTLNHRVNSKSTLKHQLNNNRPKYFVQESMLQKSHATKNKSKRLLLVEERIDTNDMEYSSSGRSEVVRSTQVETNGEFKERSTDEKATPPGTISQQLISLDEAAY